MIFNYLQLFSFNLLIETRYKPIQFMQTPFNRDKEYKMEWQLCHKSIIIEVDKENKIDNINTESSYTESPTVVWLSEFQNIL